MFQPYFLSININIKFRRTRKGINLTESGFGGNSWLLQPPPLPKQHLSIQSYPGAPLPLHPRLRRLHPYGAKLLIHNQKQVDSNPLDPKSFHFNIKKPKINDLGYWRKISFLLNLAATNAIE